MSGYGLVRSTQAAYGNCCSARGCSNKRKSGHRYCDQHKYKLLYRGDAEQQKISLKTVNFARKAVEMLISDNRNNPSWGELMDCIYRNWVSSERYVNAELNSHLGGKPSDRRVRRGLIICYDIFNNLGLEKTFITYCAWQYLHDWNPRLFVTDESFRFQLIKSLRNQAKSYHTQDLDKKTGAPRTYSSPLYMKERETAWMILIGIFGTVGMQLHKQLERRAEKLRSNKDRISNAIKQIE